MHVIFDCSNYLFIVSFTEPEIKNTKYLDRNSHYILLSKMLDVDSMSSLLHMLKNKIK